MAYTHFFYKQGKKTFQPPLCLYFLLFFSIVLHIVLQSNLHPNYAYRQHAYEKNECIRYHIM